MQMWVWPGDDQTDHSSRQRSACSLWCVPVSGHTYLTECVGLVLQAVSHRSFARTKIAGLI